MSRSSTAKCPRVGCGERPIRWASEWAAKARFATVVRRVSELPGLVYLEIEERHGSGDDLRIVNSLSVLEFDDDERIVHLDVYLQAPR